MSRVVKFIRLRSGEKILIARASFWLFFFRAGLFLSPTRFARKWVRNGEGCGTVVPEANGPAVQDVVRAVRRCKAYVPYATCLTQALTARKMLSSYGYDAVLKIGVAKSGGLFEAHAWVEVGGMVVLGRQPYHSRYAVLESPHPVLI